MTFFSRHDDSIDIHRQIASLQKELASLSRSVSKHGRAAYRGASHEASEIYGDVSERIADALPVIRRGAHQVEDSIRANPGRAIAVAGLAAALVAAAVVISGSRR